MNEPHSASPMPSRIFKSLNLLQDFAVIRQLGHVILAISYFLKIDKTVFPTFLSIPDFVVGMPVAFDMLRLTLSMPNNLLTENVTPGIFISWDILTPLGYQWALEQIMHGLLAQGQWPEYPEQPSAIIA